MGKNGRISSMKIIMEKTEGHLVMSSFIRRTLPYTRNLEAVKLMMERGSIGSNKVSEFGVLHLFPHKFTEFPKYDGAKAFCNAST